VVGTSSKLCSGLRRDVPVECPGADLSTKSLHMKPAITPAQAEAALAKIRSGRWRAHEQAKNWVGHAVAEVLGVDVHDTLGKAEVKAALKTWLASGRLRVVTAKDENSMFKQFIEVAPERR
jgi:hypothetical protein